MGLLPATRGERWTTTSTDGGGGGGGGSVAGGGGDRSVGGASSLAVTAEGARSAIAASNGGGGGGGTGRGAPGTPPLSEHSLRLQQLYPNLKLRPAPPVVPGRARVAAGGTGAADRGGSAGRAGGGAAARNGRGGGDGGGGAAQQGNRGIALRAAMGTSREVRNDGSYQDWLASQLE